MWENAVHVGRTISKQYARASVYKHEFYQHLCSPDTNVRCTKRRKSLSQTEKKATSVLTLLVWKPWMFHSIKSVIFTELESPTGQKKVKIAYKIDTGSDGNLMLFWAFKIVFPRSSMAELNGTIKDQSCLKHIINQTEHGRCSVRMRYNDICVKCRFFVVPGNGPALLVMSDIELLSIIRDMCETTDNKTKHRKVDVHTRQPELQYKLGPTDEARCR